MLLASLHFHFDFTQCQMVVREKTLFDPNAGQVSRLRNMRTQNNPLASRFRGEGPRGSRCKVVACPPAAEREFSIEDDSIFGIEAMTHVPQVRKESVAN